MTEDWYGLARPGQRPPHRPMPISRRRPATARGGERVWLSDASDPGFRHRVGVHRFTGTPSPLERAAVMFTFVGHDIHRGPPRVR